MVVQRPELWDKIEALKKRGYGIYLLSNYCKELFDKHTAGAGFLNDLDGGVISYQIHKTKPDPGIYSFLLQKYGLNPSECLFFDDRAENVEAAQKLGIAAVQITSRKRSADSWISFFKKIEKSSHYQVLLFEVRPCILNMS